MLRDLRVHFSDYSSQPDIHILCDDTWTTPSWGRQTMIQRALERREIYRSDDERYYAFDEEKVSCKECKEKIAVNRGLAAS